MYAHLRYIYGQAYYYNATETGTDEVTWAQSADQNFKVMDLSGQGELNAASSRADVLWGAAFTNINTASGIIENAAAVGTISPCADCRSQVLPRIRLLSVGANIWRGTFGFGRRRIKI